MAALQENVSTSVVIGKYEGWRGRGNRKAYLDAF